MLHPLEEKVRLRAYEIWVSAGMADGMAHDHWVSAEQAILNEQAKPKKVRAQASRAKEAMRTSKATGATLPEKKAKKPTSTRPAKAKVARVTN